MTDLSTLVAPAPSPAAAAFLARAPHGQLIGGEWRASSACFETLDPATGQLLEGDISAQTRRVFENLAAVCSAAGGSLEQVTRVGIYLTDLGDFAAVNAVMAEFFSAPYPARSTIEVSGLPRGARVEVDAILAFD